jgi:hypothetical protein
MKAGFLPVGRDGRPAVVRNMLDLAVALGQASLRWLRSRL